MKGMARRASFPSKFATAVTDLHNDYVRFENDFLQFFPQVIEFSNSFLQENYKNYESPRGD